METAVAVYPRVAFMSYSHKNDLHDGGYLSRFRGRLEGEIGVQMGGNFQIFQDRTHFEPGFRWDQSIWDLLSQSTFFLPIITPDYYESDWCRKEFEYFWRKERLTGRGPLIYPVYYIPCSQISEHARFDSDSMEYLIAKYPYADWRLLRHSDLRTIRVKRRLEEVAKLVANMYARLETSDDQTSSTTLTDLSDSFAHPLDSDPSQGYGPPRDVWMLPRAPKFFGRNSELAGILGCLTGKQGVRIAYIEGAQGIGKTVLAAEAIRHLHKMNANFRDGIAVVLCNRNNDPLIILRHILTRFDFQRRAPIQTNEEGLLAEAARLLARKDALIVLDDVVVTRSVARVIDALHALGVALLVTSTNVPSWTYGCHFNLAQLSRNDAISLLKSAWRGDSGESSSESS